MRGSLRSRCRCSMVHYMTNEPSHPRTCVGESGVMDDGRPLFQQIAELIEYSIIDGSQPEQSQVPSSNELAAFHRINPATAAKGLNQLVAEGILYKKRGIGLFVADGARAALTARRRERFTGQFLEPLIKEAEKLGMGIGEIRPCSTIGRRVDERTEGTDRAHRRRGGRARGPHRGNAPRPQGIPGRHCTGRRDVRTDTRAHLRPARPQRCRQDDDHADSRGSAAREQR